MVSTPSRFAINMSRFPSRLLAVFLLTLSGCLSNSTDKPIGPSPTPAATSSPPPAVENAITQPGAPGQLVLGAKTETAVQVLVRNAFPKLKFHLPLELARVPGSNLAVVAEHPGRILIFENSAETSSTEVFLDHRDRVLFDEAERGMISLAFAPDYQQSGYVYVSYAAGPDVDPERCAEHCSIVSRFKRSADNRMQLDPASEEFVIVLPQPGIYHNIGQLEFGEDGYLYIGVGDGYTWFGYGFSQDRTNLFGSILRIDVAQGLPYQIPPDNPFLGQGNEQAGYVGEGKPIKQEIWAYGLRNPHRFSFDSATQDMWLGDVGQNTLEEIDRIHKGGNYGWPSFEGTMPLEETDFGYQDSELLPPYLEYTRDDGRSVIGGYVYRGARLPSLFGRYLFGDFVSGQLWSLDPALPAGQDKQFITDQIGGFGMVAFDEWDGELYLANLSQGIIQTLDSGDDCLQPECEPLPQLLSQTGIFESTATLSVNPGMIAYDVNSPLWSDGTHKQRWIAIPAGETIRFSNAGTWEFPDGTVLVKHFAIDTDTTRNDDALLRLETRVLVKRSLGWLGVSYLWNQQQTDAELLDSGRELQLEITQADGIRPQNYQVPARANCSSCHNGSVGDALGVNTAQLNRDFEYANGVVNQLDALDQVELLSPAAMNPNALSRWPDYSDSSETLERRARSYLASNCSHCHNPGLAGRVDIDMRFDTALADMGLLDEPPATDDFGISDARLIKPGDPEHSILLLRMQSLDGRRMPPLASHEIDEQAVELIQQWISSLP